MDIVVAANPEARFGRTAWAGGRVAQVLRESGHQVRLVTAPDAPALGRAIRAQALQADALVVVGGDGMVQLGATAVGGTSVPLAVVPAGSGNDFATAIGMPGLEDSIVALPSILMQEPQRCDLIRVRHNGVETLVAGMVSVGFDADVNVRAMTMRRVPTKVRYEAAIVATLARLRHRTLEITVDGEQRTLHTVLAAVANNTTLGGGFRLAPSASMTDGLLTLVTAQRVSVPEFLALLPRTLRGTHETDPRIRVETCSSIDIAGDSVVQACADGEILGPLPVECAVAPEALRVFGTPT